MIVTREKRPLGASQGDGGTTARRVTGQARRPSRSVAKAVWRALWREPARGGLACRLVSLVALVTSLTLGTLIAWSTLAPMATLESFLETAQALKKLTLVEVAASLFGLALFVLGAQKIWTLMKARGLTLVAAAFARPLIAAILVLSAPLLVVAYGRVPDPVMLSVDTFPLAADARRHLCAEYQTVRWTDSPKNDWLYQGTCRPDPDACPKGTRRDVAVNAFDDSRQRLTIRLGRYAPAGARVDIASVEACRGAQEGRGLVLADVVIPGAIKTCEVDTELEQWKVCLEIPDGASVPPAIDVFFTTARRPSWPATLSVSVRGSNGYGYSDCLTTSLPASHFSACAH